MHEALPKGLQAAGVHFTPACIWDDASWKECIWMAHRTVELYALEGLGSQHLVASGQRSLSCTSCLEGQALLQAYCNNESASRLSWSVRTGIPSALCYNRRYN